MINEVAGIISTHQDIMIVSHVLPDGDSVGSSVALGLALEAMGKRVQLVNNDPVPDMYLFLPGAEKILSPSQLQSNVPDLVIAVDCTGLDRVGKNVQQLIARYKTVLVNIDHHISNSHYADYNFVEADAAAAGELVFRLIKTLGITLDLQIATAIYVALATDTGSFQYQNTGSRTHQIAAELVAAGVRPGQVSTMLYERRSETDLRLLAAVLPSLTVTVQGRLAYMSVDLNTMEQVGAVSEHCEGLVNYPKSIAGVEVALFFRQMDADTVKVAFRSKEKIDVNSLAAIFGGGGHARAAGCTIKGRLPGVVGQVVDAVIHELG